MNGPMHDLLYHGHSMTFGMGWGRLAFAALLIAGVAVLVRLTLFRNPH